MGRQTMTFTQGPPGTGGQAFAQGARCVYSLRVGLFDLPRDAQEAVLYSVEYKADIRPAGFGWTWHTVHRYRDLLELVNSLRGGNVELPAIPFPSKLPTNFGWVLFPAFRPRDAETVEERRFQLELYLNALMGIESTWGDERVRQAFYPVPDMVANAIAPAPLSLSSMHAPASRGLGGVKSLPLQSASQHQPPQLTQQQRLQQQCRARGQGLQLSPHRPGGAARPPTKPPAEHPKPRVQRVLKTLDQKIVDFFEDQSVLKKRRLCQPAFPWEVAGRGVDHMAPPGTPPPKPQVVRTSFGSACASPAHGGQVSGMASPGAPPAGAASPVVNASGEDGEGAGVGVGVAPLASPAVRFGPGQDNGNEGLVPAPSPV